MNEGAQMMKGEHDFWAFSHSLTPDINTVRQLFESRILEVEDEVWFDCIGTAFIRGMMKKNGRRPMGDWQRQT